MNIGLCGLMRRAFEGMLKQQGAIYTGRVVKFFPRGLKAIKMSFLSFV
jgi:hypothetical protein